MKKIRKKIDKFGDRFSKSKIKEIRRNLHEIENKKNLSKTRIKEIEKIFLNESQKCFDHDDRRKKEMQEIYLIYQLMKITINQ